MYIISTEVSIEAMPIKILNVNEYAKIHYTALIIMIFDLHRNLFKIRKELLHNIKNIND